MASPEAPSIDAAPAQRARAWHRRIAHLNGDVAGAFAATVIAIPQAMSLGLLAFAALGPAYASAGVVAALLASVVGNLVAASTHSVRCQVLGARASVTTVFAGLLTALVAHPALHPGGATDVPQVLAFAFLAVVAAGVLQVMFGLAGLGRAIKFIPYPVVAGFMNGIAVLIFASQIRPALGLAGQASLATTLAQLPELVPGSLATAAATVAAIFVGRRRFKRVPPLVCGLVAGLVVHYGIALFSPAAVGALVGPLPAAMPGLDEARNMVQAVFRADAGILLSFVLPSALLIAVVGSLDGLLAAVVVDTVTRGRHDSNRVLVGQGLAAVAGAAFGALPAVLNTHTPVANYLAGGRTRIATLLHSFFVLAALFVLGPLFAGVPVAALAGLMMFIAYTLVDTWSRELVLRIAAGRRDRSEMAFNVLIVVMVAAAQVLLNVMIAVVVGFVASVGLLLVKLSGSPVRRKLDGGTRTSLKVRSPEARHALAPLARRIQVLELEGELFFGTADHLQSELDAMPEGTRVVILDFRRVHQIDATGARVVELLAHRAERRDVTVVLSHVRESDRRGHFLLALGLDRVIPGERWFPDLDRALEWAEDQMLQRARFEDEAEVALSGMALFDGLEEAAVAKVASVLERRVLRGGDPVFLEGQPGDELFLIARGAVSIKVALHHEGHARRLATFTAGVMFGEMALLEGQRRSADAFAKGELVVLYALSARALEAITRDDPRLGLRIHRNIARELAARLRATSGALRSLE